MSQFDKLLTHPTPINRSAVRVAFGSGDNWEAKPLAVHWETYDAPPKPHINPKASMPDADLVGLKVGKMTVVQLQTNKSTIRWLCRCECGKYEIRRDQSIKKQLKRGRPTRASCAVCLSRQLVTHPMTSPIQAARDAGALRRERRLKRIAEMVAETGRPWGRDL